MVDNMIITNIFGLACLFWGVLIMLGSIFDKESFIAEGKKRWKAIMLSVILLAAAALCLYERIIR